MEYTPYKRVYKITPISNITIGIKKVESVLYVITCFGAKLANAAPIPCSRA